MKYRDRKKIIHKQFGEDFKLNRANYPETFVGSKESIKRYVNVFWKNRSQEDVAIDKLFNITKINVEQWLIEEFGLLIRGPLEIKAVGGSTPTIKIPIREFADNLESLISGSAEASKGMLAFCTQEIINKYDVRAIALGDNFVTYCNLAVDAIADEFESTYKKKRADT
jgi:hypothetical protein